MRWRRPSKRHGGDAELKAELGDVLLQVVLHARLAQERGAFDLDDVARGLTAKMIRRNPHVFRPDGSLQESFPATVEEIVQTWDAVKRSEQVLHSGSADSSAGTLPAGGPSTASPPPCRRWPGPKTPGPRRTGRLPASAGPVDVPSSEEDLGDLLFAIAAAARARGLDAERALRGANRRFQAGPPAAVVPVNRQNDVRGLDRFL